ncbi:mucin-binding protein [Limosilactobacillus reuteri]|uniref:mucin-binding protein n=1 Tax=Limosilactobacillus reuteri TaxID=1598 RepID=UPI002D1FA93C|nr:PT domain-containing protein [Limosilactobacillus reuteri]
MKGNSSIDLTYNKDGVWKSATGGDNADNLIHKRYTIKFVHDVKSTTENTSVSRNIHYVADEGNSKYEVLKDPDTQTVNFERTAYVDQVTKQEVAKNADGTYSELPSNFMPTWKAVGTDNFAQIQKDRFNKDEGKVSGVWEIERANYDDPEGTQLTDNFAPEVANVDAAKTYKDIYLVYREKAQYNIHYIDVNGVEGKTTYAPTDGHELTDHLVSNVGEGKGIFVGDTPDATQKLWSPAGYEKAGYVLVGLSDNAKDDLLGKQTLAHGVQDQYVYLKHAVKTITPNTPVEDVPKDSDGKRAIDPSDLHKEFTRNIAFVANNDAKSPLKDAVSQKVEFDGHIYVDMVTGQTTTPETVKDANGKRTQVATTKAGNIEWNHDTQTMDEVVQKYITLNTGDKYATSDDMVGTWHWISGTADEINLKPTSNNPEDLVLVYEKNKGESSPSTDYDLPKLDYGQSGPSTDYDLPKLDYGQSGPELNYDLPKAEIPSQPTSQPTVQPTEQPTSQPTAQPTEQPTSQPTAQPTEQPAIESNTQLPGEQKNEEPQPMTTQVNTKKGETSIVEPTNSSSTQPTTKQGAQQLPQTGNQKSSSLIGLGFAGLLSALGLTKVNKKRKD